MKTVQEYFKEVKEEELINYYLYKHPIKLEDISNDWVTVREIKEIITENLRAYIERLRNMTIEASLDNQEHILFCHDMMENGISTNTSSLVCLDELMEKKEEAQTYDYIFTPQSEMLGFYVAETEYTKDNLIQLLVDVMHTASVCGFKQEHLQETIKEIECSIRNDQTENAQYYSIDEIYKEFGIKIRKNDSQEEELRGKATHTIWEYNQYCEKKALKELLAMVEEYALEKKESLKETPNLTYR